MHIGALGGNPPTRGALHKAQLDQERLIHILNRIYFFRRCRRQRG